jgi:hypothetical protein
MEMNFPHLETRSVPIAKSVDYRALLSTAISRQGNSHTARVMRNASHQSHSASLSAYEIMSERIRYFALHAGKNVNGCAPHGAFFPVTEPENTNNSTYEDVVYQDASMNGKDRLLDASSSEPQMIMSGQENSRTL